MSLRRFAQRYAPKKKAPAAEYNNETSLCVLGHSHRSKLEAAVCHMLLLRFKAGEIDQIQAEVRVLICGPEGHECNHRQRIESIVDFSYRDIKTGLVCFAEAKGFESPKWPIKKRLWIHNRIERLEIWKGSWSRLRLDEVING